MAIQQIDLAVPNGDTVRSANVKINQNFSNTTHAASRLVGTGAGQVPIISSSGFAKSGIYSDGALEILTEEEVDNPSSVARSGFYRTFDSKDSKVNLTTILQVPYPTNPHGVQLIFGITNSNISFRRAISSTEYSRTFTVYHDGNTTIGTNKELVTSSPVVRVFSDTIEAIHEANDLPLEFIRNGEGDYTLKGTTGLRDGQNDWQIIIPKDDHDNQLIAFTLDEDTDGTINLKTYKRTFSMETFTFGPDLNTPLDIPAGRWVDLHFKDLPQEEIDEPIE